MELPVLFRKRFNEARKSAGLSLRSLARASGNSPSKLEQIANGKFDTSKDGPGLFAVHRVTASLGVTMDELAPKHATDRPGVNALLSRYRGVETPIKFFGDYLRFCDVYSEPSNGHSHIDRLGPQSLLSETSGMSDAALIQIEYERWPSARKKKIFDRQRRAWDHGYVIDGDIYLPDFSYTNVAPTFPLLLVICKVIDTCETPKLLIYAEPLGEHSQSSNKQ